MSEPEFTKESLTAKILSARKVFEDALARVPTEQMETPILHEAWSVKDVLGHLGFWEARTLSRFAGLRAGTPAERITDMDALNARVLADTRRLSLDEVRRQEREAYQGLLDLVQHASPDELFDPAHFPGTDGNAFVGWVEGNTWDHYAEHLVELLAWLEKDARA